MSFALTTPRLLNRDLLSVGLPLTAVIGSLVIHLLLEKGGGILSLSLIPVAVMPALSMDRLLSALGIGSAVIADLFMIPLESTSDTLVNALLLVVAGILSSQARRRYKTLLEPPFVAPGPGDGILDTVLSVSPVVMLDNRGAVVSITASASRMFGIEPNAADGRPFAALVDHFVPQGHGSVPATPNRWLGRRSTGHVFPLDIASMTVTRNGAVRSILHLSDAEQHGDTANSSRKATDQMYRIWRLNSLGLMAATLAHELSQPLTAAATYMHASQIDMDRAGPLGDSANRTLGLAKHQILRAGQIIDKLHDLLAPGSGNRRPERVSAMIGDLNGILEPLCRGAGVTLRISVDTDSDTVLVDGSQVQQIIVNLVRNAVEAVSGQVHRDVTINGRPLTTAVFEIRIEDSGPGFGLDNGVAGAWPGAGNDVGGLGLGLSLTRSLIERQGGVLMTGRSEDLGGAAVRFTLERAGLEGPT